MESSIVVVGGNELSAEQEIFFATWAREYFAPVTVSHELEKAAVHWRLFLTVDGMLVSHVALTELLIVRDGRQQFSGAVGGLITVREKMGMGYGNQLMDAAESFLFEKLGLESGILFCLPALVPFYERRGWIRVRTPVILEQPSGLAVWPEAVMTFSRQGDASANSFIHVPAQLQRNSRTSGQSIIGSLTT